MSLISVIIPAYNAAKHIKGTIQSVIDQTYSNWELLVINDGSTDNTVEVVQAFLTDSRIKLINQQNAGVSASRNKGAELAKGDILAFLDADDLWVPTYLERKNDALLKSGPEYGLVLSYTQQIDGDLAKTNKYYSCPDRNIFQHLISFEPDTTTCPSNVFIKKEVFFQTEGFNLSLSNAADKLFLIHASLKTKCLLIKEVLWFYKVHSANMHQNISLMVSDYIRLFKQVESEGLFEDRMDCNICYARMYKICAFAYLKELNILQGIYYLFKAFFRAPIHLVEFIINKSTVRKLGFRTLANVGVLQVLTFFNRASGKIPIVVFHRVAIEKDPFWPPLRPDEFESIIKEMSKRYTFITPEQLLKGNSKELRNSCLVMFDDGYLDFYTYALPIINEYKVPVTMFVSAENTLKQESIWTQQIDSAIANTDKKRLSITIRGVEYIFKLSSTSQKLSASGQIRNLLINLHPDEFEIALSSIKQELGYDPSSVAVLMNYEQINSIKETVSFQSHSLTHKFLPSLSEDELKVEMERSKTTIENQLHKDVSYIAYPIGGWNDSVAKVASQFYKAAFAVDNKMVSTKKLKDSKYIYHIPRFNMHYANPKEVLMRINGFHRLIGK